MQPNFAFALILLLLAVVTVLPTGCASTAADGPGEIDFSKLTLASASDLPDYVQDAPPRVQEAYRFALANPRVLEKIPCYCGCNALGHMNNLDCYVVANTGGEFEPHAAYWTICIDITRDVMAMLSQGKELAEIRDYIDTTYADAGPPTETEPVIAGQN